MVVVPGNLLCQSGKDLAWNILCNILTQNIQYIKFMVSYESNFNLKTVLDNGSFVSNFEDFSSMYGCFALEPHHSGPLRHLRHPNPRPNPAIPS